METPHTAANFIYAIIREDLKQNKNAGRVHTRFPPEPNGYLHIGHAKSICLNFGAALEFGGKCNLRFDDTNPAKEDTEYVDSIRADVRWLGFDWEDRLYYASDYFPRLYDFACRLIEKGLAYVCDLSAEEIRAYRGTLTEPGRESPYRERSAAENMDLFQRMRAGEFPNGARVLRARIDMASPNLNLRDPVLYRILHQAHHRTGDAWCIYPLYDFAHPLSDAIEGVTHSICTMEFEDHRPLYDWLTDNLIEENPPRQYEFARLDLTCTIMSKRLLRHLVEEGVVSGWDDPRMPTLSGLRRRGYTPEAIRNFCERIGVAKANSLVDTALLEYCLREDLNRRAERRMLVLRPLKVVIDNYPPEQIEYLEAENHPDSPEAGVRLIPFGREIYIENEDFMEDPPKKYFRLRPGGEVRLKHAYIITCTDLVRDDAGRVSEVHCLYDPLSKSGGPNAGRKVRGTLHWVAARESVPLEVRLYDSLLQDAPENPEAEEDGDLFSRLNPASLEVCRECRGEPALAAAGPGERFQFLRLGYFCADSRDAAFGHPVFNRIVGLRDTWAKIAQAQ
ncbi:MAG: glutamine--tRNA ligase/YqeY domain fusion protein [Gracilibacteraceae bacterium]|nr:glutamine--tRNA ligase/YqeY domain fusion protein [Gracilibacteraceae bacterium]